MLKQIAGTNIEPPLSLCFFHYLILCIIVNSYPVSHHPVRPFLIDVRSCISKVAAHGAHFAVSDQS